MLDGLTMAAETLPKKNETPKMLSFSNSNESFSIFFLNLVDSISLEFFFYSAIMTLLCAIQLFLYMVLAGLYIFLFLFFFFMLMYITRKTHMPFSSAQFFFLFASFLQFIPFCISFAISFSISFEKKKCHELLMTKTEKKEKEMCFVFFLFSLHFPFSSSVSVFVFFYSFSASTTTSIVIVNMNVS